MDGRQSLAVGDVVRDVNDPTALGRVVAVNSFLGIGQSAVVAFPGDRRVAYAGKSIRNLVTCGRE